MPICELIDPTKLYVGPAYQRDIGERGLRQIRRIVTTFDWAKFKPPICAYAEHEGTTILKVLDGQHTAIAAASHPDIREIPVMIVEAENTVDQARAFIGQNSERLGVTTLQMHQAAIAAGDEDALTLELVCQRAGVRVLKRPGTYSASAPRETIAINSISALINRNGVKAARQVLEVLANAERGPLTAPQIKAVELLMTDPEYCEKFAPEDLTEAIIDLLFTAEDEAKLYALTHKIPLWRALAVTWCRKTKKRRAVTTKAA
jgi:hypothetical protein